MNKIDYKLYRRYLADKKFFELHRVQNLAKITYDDWLIWLFGSSDTFR